MVRLRFIQILAVAALVAVPALGKISPAGAASATRHVSTTGHDTGDCTASPCKTVNYALGQANAGDTVQVAAGTYNQTIDIEKAITLIGAGAGKTIIDGKGLDTTGPDYGVLKVGTPTTPGGTVNVEQFTFTDPFPYSYTGGEPEAVAFADANAADHVNFFFNFVTEGTADSARTTDFPIGIDTFKNAANTSITFNAISGFFQGALLEDNGPAVFNRNQVSGLIANTDMTTNPPTTYPAEGVFFLSDLSGSLHNQYAENDTFKSYSGDGVIMEAGYNNGNCTATPCNGSLDGRIQDNSFALGGANNAAGIELKSKFTGNDLTARVVDNTGYVTSPDDAIVEDASGGGSMHVSETDNSIVVHPASSNSTVSPSSAPTQDGGLRARKAGGL